TMSAITIPITTKPSAARILAWMASRLRRLFMLGATIHALVAAARRTSRLTENWPDAGVCLDVTPYWCRGAVSRHHYRPAGVRFSWISINRRQGSAILKGKRAVVTGSTGGIGLASARVLAGSGE